MQEDTSPSQGVEPSDNEEEDDIPMRELMAAVAAMGQKIEEMGERLNRLEGSYDKDEPEDKEPNAMSEVDALRAQIELMESVNTVMDELGCERKEAQTLARIRKLDAAGYAYAVEMREKAQAARSPTTTSEIGAGGVAPATGRKTYEQVLVEMREKGIKPGFDEVQYMKKHAPYLLAQ